MRVSLPSSSNRHSSTRSACSEKSEKLVPPPSHVRAERERPAGPDLASPHQRSGQRRRARTLPVAERRARHRRCQHDRRRAAHGQLAGLVRRSCTRARTSPRAHAQPARMLVELDRLGLARAAQLAAERAAAPRRGAASAGSRSRVSFERSNVCSACGSGISSANDAKAANSCAPALAGGLGDLRVDVVGEELERARPRRTPRP